MILGEVENGSLEPRGGVPVKHGIRQRLRLLWRVMANGLLAGAIFLLFLSFKSPIGAKAHVYALARDVMKKSLEIQTFNWYAMDGERFRVKYQPVDAQVARLILETAEESFEPVSQMLGYIPTKQVSVFIYPTRVSLNKSFGWDAAVDAMGVYWAGAIRILSPLDWVEDQERLPEIFREKGPLTHEYAHLLVDYRTNGNYPRWLTEGIAQYVERELIGFEFSGDGLGQRSWYSFQKMDAGFDRLPDQGLAYKQSLLAVDYLVETGGFEMVLGILDELAFGRNIDKALEKVAGQDLVSFDLGFKIWVNDTDE